MLRAEVRHICGIGRPANFRLGVQLEHIIHIMGSAMISKVRGHSDEVTCSVLQVLDCKLRRKILRNTKIGRRVAHATNNNVHQF